ncbi:MAG TPA: hypothetical protein PLX69_08880 [Leptospiraceae bacterium]|nr:hypothetical protein [Leptospiraceae bacterium]
MKNKKGLVITESIRNSLSNKKFKYSDLNSYTQKPLLELELEVLFEGKNDFVVVLNKTEYDRSTGGGGNGTNSTEILKGFITSASNDSILIELINSSSANLWDSNITLNIKTGDFVPWNAAKMKTKF